MRAFLDVLKQSFTEVSDAVMSERPRVSLESPLSLLSYSVSGEAGTFLVIAGRPGVGKTSMALGIAAESCAAGRKALYVSPGARAPELALRVACAEAQVDISRPLKASMAVTEWERLCGSAEALRALSEALYIDDAPFVTAPSLAATVERFVAEKCKGSGRPPIVIVDYIQLLRSEPRRPSRYEELCDASFALKSIARRFDVAMIGVSQLNRNIDDRGRGALPKLSDLRDSGTIEDEANAVVLLHEERSFDDDPDSRTVIIAKNNLGPSGTFVARLHRGAWADAPTEDEQAAQ